MVTLIFKFYPMLNTKLRLCNINYFLDSRVSTFPTEYLLFPLYIRELLKPPQTNFLTTNQLNLFKINHSQLKPFAVPFPVWNLFQVDYVGTLCSTCNLILLYILQYQA